MSGRTGRAGRVLILGLALGVAADQLLWDGPIGPGFAVWIALLGGAAVYLSRVEETSHARAVAGWSVVAVAAAAGLSWRGSPELLLGFFLAVVLAASAALLRARGGRLWRTRVGDHLHGLALAPWQAAVGAVPVVFGAETSSSRWWPGWAGSVARGLLLALPFLVVFGLLFIAADPWLERQATRLAAALDTLPTHVLLVLVFGWIAGGLLAGLVPANRAGREGRPSGVDLLAGLRLPRVGTAEATVALGLVAALFTLFVASQFRYMFGGAAAIEAISGLTLAEYARRGFFELVFVAGLTLVLLLAVDATAPGAPDEGRGRGPVRWLSGALVALVMLAIASAGLRLRLYVDTFGLTTARIYAAAVMIWLSVTLLLFAATALRGRVRPFASGAFLACLGTILGLAVLNPDATVARVNLDRVSERAVDADYLARLGPDAAPVLAARLDRLPMEDRCRLTDAIRERWADDEGRDWRTWNAARSAAAAVGGALAPCETPPSPSP